ncbi:hypothetical protein SAMN05216228_102091 [Rhizobium tibeticum]|uniref:Uncharacterized protein n=1 Tax=Rhizobium tibeticum TaxID=501024 RepID=A0A1H8R236_9HYPH|nr:hypothetical protein RTCCBAU85039_4050 [Rhizobium tibeticum]SEO60689.1 hypothetical protein SAMN05216228_102091 [Rhizobium tibeticum]
MSKSGDSRAEAALSRFSPQSVRGLKESRAGLQHRGALGALAYLLATAQASSSPSAMSEIGIRKTTNSSSMVRSGSSSNS